MKYSHSSCKFPEPILPFLPVQRLSVVALGALREVVHSVLLQLPQARVEGQKTDIDI